MATIKIYEKKPFLLKSPTGRSCDNFIIKLQQWDETGEEAVVEIQLFDVLSRIGARDETGEFYLPDMVRHITVTGLDDEMSMEQIRNHTIAGKWKLWPEDEDGTELDFEGSVYKTQVIPDPAP